MPTRFLIEANPEPNAQSQAQTAPSVGAELQLDAQRSHYLCRVMRIRNGASVECFDGRGTAFSATLAGAERKTCTLLVNAVVPAQPPAAWRLHLAMSLLKGQAMDRALQQATELGATAITLLDAQRSNAKLTEGREENRMTHWRRIIAGACEQSGRLHVPPLHPPVGVAALLSATADTPMVFDIAGAALPNAMDAAHRLLLIGPEGGWDDAERAWFTEHGVACYRLTANVLRAETAPAVALAMLQQAQAAGVTPAS